MTESPAMVDLPVVRRLEAVGFRSWPATSTIFDKTWAIRLTAGHPSKRVNSVNPLDRGDLADLENRIDRARQQFSNFGRPLVFRQSPLAPPVLNELFDRRGWRCLDETKVMLLDLHEADFSGVVDQLPLKNADRWIDQCIAMGSLVPSVKPGLLQLIDLVEGDVGLFLSETADGQPQAAAMAVHSANLVGLFEIVSNPQLRRRGMARRILRTALLWANENGASQAWLQAVASNLPATMLYQSEGFREAYRYVYRQAPDTLAG